MFSRSFQDSLRTAFVAQLNTFDDSLNLAAWADKE